MVLNSCIVILSCIVVIFKRLTLVKEALIEIGCVVTSLVVGCHARALWQNGAYSYYGTLIGNPTPGIQRYNFRPPGVTPNRGMGPHVRRFLSNYFDLLLCIIFDFQKHLVEFLHNLVGLPGSFSR